MNERPDSRREDRRTALVIEHERPTPPGLIADWLELRGIELEIVAIDDGQSPREPISDYELIFSLGSEFPAYDDTIPWLATEMELLHTALDERVPIFGVCFGGQLLARVLGGEVMRSTREEIGWLGVNSDDPGLVGAGPWFQWHFDTFTVPAKATTIAASPVGPQAFASERSFGVKFHPEVTPEIMERWVDSYRHELDETGVDPDRLLTETNRRAEQSRELSFELFDRFYERVSEVAEAEAR
jgi:GMP synthase-like glutamine amidotransferase